jgi:hypothetical protein
MQLPYCCLSPYFFGYFPMPYLIKGIFNEAPYAATTVETAHAYLPFAGNSTSFKGIFTKGIKFHAL